MVFFAVPGNTDSHDLGLWKVGPDAAPASSKQVGLFHVAWQVEREEDLRAFHDSLVARGIPVRLTMDHGANLSVYFDDPDGNMLEVTYEKPRETWPPGLNPFAGREPLRFQAVPR
jgi:catechol-2,3-dioxygenase